MPGTLSMSLFSRKLCILSKVGLVEVLGKSSFFFFESDRIASEAKDLEASLSIMIFRMAVLLLPILSLLRESAFSCLLLAYFSYITPTLSFPDFVDALLRVVAKYTKKRGLIMSFYTI